MRNGRSSPKGGGGGGYELQQQLNFSFWRVPETNAIDPFIRQRLSSTEARVKEKVSIR